MIVYCQGCFGPITPGEKAKRVSYGILYITGHPHANLRRELEYDYYHARCDAGFRDYPKGSMDSDQQIEPQDPEGRVLILAEPGDAEGRILVVD